MHEPTTSSFHRARSTMLKWAVVVALVIVTNLFFHYFVATVYPQPKLDQFCPPQTQMYPDAPSSACNANYTIARVEYRRNAFIILVVMSLAVLSFSLFTLVDILSVAFAWAGVLGLIIASFRYWSEADNWMHVVILVVAMVLLIWLAVKKFKNE